MIRKGYVDTRDGQIHYRYSKEGTGIPLVMFHATAGSSASFEPVMREMEGVLPLFAPDTVNYGESYRTDAEPSIGLISDALLEALSAIGVDRFHAYGHHTGVNIAVDMALRAPERVASVMAHSPNYISMEANEYCRVNLAKDHPIHVKGTQLFYAWNKVKDMMGEVIWLNPPHAAEILNRDTIDTLRAGEKWHWASRAVYAHDLMTAIKQVKCPLFLLRGRREPAGSFAVHEQAVRDLPHARAYAHEEGGVYAQESHPADFAREIISFIRDVEQAPR